MAELDRDITSPLPAEPTDRAPSAALAPQATATWHFDQAARTSTGPAVGPGTVLRQRYVLERELGGGGMGTVYRALDRNKEDLPPPNRPVAVKVLREEFAHRPDALQALRREAHQAQALSHPGIVNVFDFDRDGDVYFITMELLEGELLSDLMQRIRPGKLPRQAATDLLRDLGNAVAYAHSRGVLHMDLKPGNVMITSQGDVRVLDFGLAYPHVTEPWISDHPPPFHAATPTYASCEQLDGAAPDLRDDVFSLACVAYELLSGEHPFGRCSAREARDQGQRPRRIRGLSRSEWRALRQGLAWNRGDRPRSVTELLQGLGLVATAQRAQPGQRFKRHAERPGISRWWLATTGLGILAVGLYVAWARLAPDSGPETIIGILRDGIGMPRDDNARLSPHEEQPRAVPATADSTSLDSTPAVPELTDSQVTAEEIVPADFATAIAATVAPTPDIAATVAPTPLIATAAAGPGRLGFATNTITVSESAGAVPLRVFRRGGATGTVSFSWKTVDDSAIAERDYAARGTVRESIGPGETSKTVLIPIVSDAVKESTELFDVVIENPTAGATLGTNAQVTVIVVDDD
ncbi:MAG: protein kinase [Proteobacteria bacterium]|nr:protein kinase [Pseudomonadota bacterium]